MRWEDEAYVRVYTRDTVEWNMLGWEAQALFLLLLRKVDRAGLLDMGRPGVRGLSATLRMPPEVVERALAELLEDRCVQQRDTVLVVPNFIEAQEAKSSDRHRKREQRARDRAQRLAPEPGSESNSDLSTPHVTAYDQSGQPVTACDQNGQCVTPRDQTGQTVTKRDIESRIVTESHTESHAVTAGHTRSLLAELSIAEQSIDNMSEPDPSGSSEPVGSAPTSNDVRRVFDTYVAARKAAGQGGAPPLFNDKRKKLIKARIKDHGLEMVVAAAAGIWRSGWHLDHGVTSIDYALRNAEHVEQFAPLAPAPTRLPGQPSLFASDQDDPMAALRRAAAERMRTE